VGRSFFSTNPFAQLFFLPPSSPALSCEEAAALPRLLCTFVFFMKENPFLCAVRRSHLRKRESFRLSRTTGHRSKRVLFPPDLFLPVLIPLSWLNPSSSLFDFPSMCPVFCSFAPLRLTGPPFFPIVVPPLSAEPTLQVFKLRFPVPHPNQRL